MLWKMLRPHFWMLDRQVRATNRLLVVALIVLLLFGGQWLFNSLVDSPLANTSPDQATPLLAPVIPFGLFVMLLFTVLGVGDIIYQLFLAPDLELLMLAPIPPRLIFTFKLLQVSRAAALPAILIMASLMFLGWTWDASPLFYPLMAAFFAAEVMLVTAVVLSLVIALARWLPPRRVRSWIPAAVSLVALAMALGNQSATRWFTAQTDMIVYLGESLLDVAKLGKLVAGIGVSAAVAVIVAYQLFKSGFHEGWNRFQVVPVTERVGPHRIQAKGRHRWLRLLPVSYRHSLPKEWLQLRRDPQGLMGLALPLVYMVMVSAPILGVKLEEGSMGPLLYWYLLFFLAFLTMFQPLSGTLISLMLEGKNISLLRTLPLSFASVLKGKFLATAMPLMALWTVLLLAFGLWKGMPMGQIGLLLGTVLVGLAGGSVATLALAGLWIDFTIDNPKKRLSTPASYLITGINGLYVLLTVVSSTWLMIGLYPDSDPVMVIRTLQTIPVVGWTLSTSLWLPLTLFAGHLAFWMGARRLWRAGVRRLEQWEGGSI